jgi:predicted component of type VI protein secretion system
MVKSVRLVDDTGMADMEPLIPIDRVVSVRGDGSCYLSDQCFFITDNMIYVEPVVEPPPEPTIWDRITSVMTMDVTKLFTR